MEQGRIVHTKVYRVLKAERTISAQSIQDSSAFHQSPAGRAEVLGSGVAAEEGGEGGEGLGHRAGEEGGARAERRLLHLSLTLSSTFYY